MDVQDIMVITDKNLLYFSYCFLVCFSFITNFSNWYIVASARIIEGPSIVFMFFREHVYV